MKLYWLTKQGQTCTVSNTDLGNCEEELPKKPVGQLSVNCRPTVGQLSADISPTDYRQATKRRKFVMKTRSKDAG